MMHPDADMELATAIPWIREKQPPRCETCNYGVFEGDPSVGIPWHYYCDAPDSVLSQPIDILDSYINAGITEEVYEERLAAICGAYWPRMVGECVYCRKTIDSTIKDWEIWVCLWELSPCCSANCALKAMCEFDAQTTDHEMTGG